MHTTVRHFIDVMGSESMKDDILQVLATQHCINAIASYHDCGAVSEWRLPAVVQSGEVLASYTLLA